MEKLLKVLTEANDEIDFENEKAMVDDGILDSLEMLRIISALQEAYGIHINVGELDPDNFNSAEAILAMVNKHLETGK